MGDFERATWKNADLLEELAFWTRLGLSHREVAAKIGVKVTTLRQAIYRARVRTNQQLAADKETQHA